MSILFVLPVKDLSHSKSRLSFEIEQKQRELLVCNLIRRTIAVAKSAACAGDILLVSRDDRVLDMAKTEGAYFLAEQGSGLNQALEQAAAWAQKRSYAALLVLPLDIPFLAKEDVDSIIGLSEGKEKVCVIAPDEAMMGTNVLLVKPPGILQYQFGPGSFLKHRRQARNRHIQCEVYRSMRVCFDLDSPLQYRRLVEERRTESGLCRKS